ncbi:MOP superfamily multidrug/oligosaccharidyl-lipid/polysaccharide flippase transporter [Streptococcus australis]|uniref:Tat pathway signal sequence domain protein n=1 Tax=Streptococcus australis ATCC 700641 TaxID=888833 RepID=E7SA25_9STRE|nr:polysaccharide biosynthesis protein [Streptococcus australis]EFV99582.1 Tat pathway signal sequence domain protein [Streptococcus australis ATCC 700641]EGU63762.1 polysaccharide biosynthesis protein [Streptococcus australis ATCC 700641]SQH66886.1 MOP superfamily multidrug/oligosaccharidyl-lipid/polysaccharide flippase transporter [Streptococcus australis]
MSNETSNQQAQMLRGTVWLTASNFISRLLGAAYIIPWYIWMGKHGAEANGLFTMGYNIYAWFLLISTAGVPVAVAKQVAKYNTKRQEEHSYAMIRGFLKFMSLLGLIFAIIMYLLSPVFAKLSGGGKDLIPVMQSLSWAVLIFPSMSVIRGFFQGHNNLKPYAISQIAEQVIRVIWMLLTAYFIMKVGSGNYVEAVTQSTFAAFIGMGASLLVLFYYLWKTGLLKHIIHRPESDNEIDTKALLWDTIREAIPFIVTGSAIQLFQIIDQMTYSNVMSWFTNYTRSELLVQFSYFSANPNKITMILIAVATSIGGVGIPLLTENYVKGDFRAAGKLVQDNLTMLVAFLLPATIGAVAIAEPLYTVFYGKPDSLALGLFILAMLQTVILGLYTVLSPMIQALFQNRKAILYFGYGVLVKLILQVPFIYLFRAYGPLLSTTIGLMIPIVLMYKEIHRVTHFNRKIVFKRSLLTAILTLIMLLVVLLSVFILGFVIKPNGRVMSMIYVALIGGVGIIVYGGLGLRLRFLDRFIGNKAASLRNKFHIS